MINNTSLISVVIPVYNEEDNISSLHTEIVDVCEKNNYDYEIIIVDDGSDDSTGAVARKLSPATYIRMRRNFGQTSALDCGIKHSSGRYIVTLDGDGQNDPADIPRLIEYLEENNLDLVSGWRKERKDPIFKRLSSRIAALLRRLIIHDNLHDSGCTLKVYKAECFEGISLFGEMHRFIPGVLRIKGFNVGELEVNHRRRQSGKTKYNWQRGIKGFLDMIGVWFWHKYAVRPLHLLGGIGALLFFAGTLTSITGICFYFMGIQLFRFFLPVLSSFLLTSGMQIFLFGLIADMLAKNYFQSTPDTPYSVAEIKNNQ
ncbi:MAG: glycosyltransferase family 2 protein, partial [bacterium]